MNINAAFPSNYIKASDIEGDTIVTIKNVKQELLGQGKDAEEKPVLYTEEFDKGMVLNKVNAKTISNIHGPETDDWEGKRITLFVTEVQYGAEMMPGIRVRTKAPAGKPAVAPKGGNTAGPEAAKRAAWTKFKTATPGSTKEQQEAFTQAVQEYFPEKGEDTASITAEEWEQFANDDFVNMPV